MTEIQLAPGKLAVRTSMSVVASPRPGIGISEARDRWLAANPGNKVLDFGDRNQPDLLVASTKGKQVLYELVPELSPPGFTVQQMMDHMRALGCDVRGEGPRSVDGNPTVVVYEQEN